MAIQIADNFSYKGSKPLDARSKYATLAAMKAAAEADLYDGCMAYVDADGKYYTFNSANTVDATTGKWRVFESGGGASDLADLGDVNLTSPTNGQVMKYDAINEKWVNGDESGGGGGGHEILDNGTAMTARAGLNFVDFDISDDSTDNETEVSAHRLTSAEMEEIMGTLPGTPTELPVLFDETGAERVVGWYVTSAGKKPVYLKCNKGTTPNSDSLFIADTLDNPEVVLSVDFFTKGTGKPFVGLSRRMELVEWWVRDNGEIAMAVYSAEQQACTYWSMTQYTKTTDNPS